ncbi:hypothetical protein F511_26714 [Dorcoceras hygrometricum]|uniref:Uncharacterized protein n=1 Tax=Dorcoceras hygrometricum TaxID=472368 RepID=A0A2Z7CFH8_9LAMI|nr:hypothetical protein F511_26714 [Dorcoceras hygrometricum]
MASSRRKEKSVTFLNIFVVLLVSFGFPPFAWTVFALELEPSSDSCTVVERESEDLNTFRKDVLDHGSDSNVVLREQLLQLEKLEGLVKNLTELVSRLESRLLDTSEGLKVSPLSSLPQYDTSVVEKVGEDEELQSEEDALPEEVASEGSLAQIGSVTKYNTFWSEKFQFVSAVKLGSTPTCVNVLPYRDFEGVSKYFAVGDDKGKVYVFLRSGDVSVQFDTHSEPEEASPVSAIISYLSVNKNESMIVTGHENGVIVMHRAWEVLNSEDLSFLQVERVERFVVPDRGGFRINLLEVHNFGRKRYILTTDNGGRITVFRENGVVVGTATPSRRPIVFLKQRLLFLTESGAGSLDLRTMKIKESECEGMNNSVVKSYVFDATDRSKAYGFTSEGELIHTLLLGDAVNFKCRVRSKRKLDLDEPVALQAIKGYLLIANRKKIFVYNVSSQHYVRAGGLRLLFSSGFDEIITSFLHQQVVNINVDIPLVTSDYEKLVILSLGNGYLAMYRSNLPLFKNEFNSILWSSPVLVFILFLFGAWQFFANKKEALTSWGPDDPFSSTPVADGAPLGSVTGDRSFPESSRNSEIMDVRGGGLRGPSRRYGSPSRYPGGNTGPYRSGSDTDSRHASVEPLYRATSDLNFRGSPVEAKGAVKRRDGGLFVNSQAADDSN